MTRPNPLHHYIAALPTGELAKVQGDRKVEAVSLGNLGSAYQSLGESRRAIEYQEQSLAITREIGDRNGEAHALQNLGLLYQKVGRTQEGFAAVTKAMEIRQSMNLPLNAYPLPKWMKQIARFAQRGNYHLALCFLGGFIAFPFFLFFFITLTLWRQLARLWRR